MAQKPSRGGTDLQVIRPNRRKHYEAIKDLSGKSFGGYFSWQERSDVYLRNSHYDWDASAIGVQDGEVLTHWGVWGYMMRIGLAEVRSAGIGAVCCHGAYRKHGLMTKTIRGGLDIMREQGYDVTILFGIPDFYHRFGYVQAWPMEEIIVEAKRLPTESPNVQPRRFAAKYRDDLGALYNRESVGLTGTAVRPTYLRSGERDWKGVVWNDARGRAAGYLLFDEHRGTGICPEYCGKPEQVLRVLGSIARRRRWQEVKFPSPHRGHPVVKQLLRGFARAETRYQASGGAMIRTLNLRSTLEKISRELTIRLKASELASWNGTLLISDAREKVALKIGRGKVSVADARTSKHSIRGGDQVAQLLIGTDTPREVAEAGKMRMAGDAARLADALFPAQHPVLNRWDHF